MIADLSQMGVPAAYLGVETQGLSGSTFGGRADFLTDDVVDIDLDGQHFSGLSFLS